MLQRAPFRKKRQNGIDDDSQGEERKEERAGGRREGRDGGGEGRRRAEWQFEIHANWAHSDFSLCLCFPEGEQSDATAMRSSLFTAHAQGGHKTRLKGSLPLSGLIWTQELLGSMPPSFSVQSHMSSAKCYIGHILWWIGSPDQHQACATPPPALGAPWNCSVDIHETPQSWSLSCLSHHLLPALSDSPSSALP